METFADIGFAKLDLSRTGRTGTGEVVFCAGKTAEQLAKIYRTFDERNAPVLGTRCSAEQAEFVKSSGIPVEFDATARTLVLRREPPVPVSGRIAVCTGGTADIPVAEEAVRTAEFFGASVDRFFDVGVAGLHRLLSKVEEIGKADVVIAVAGMEGALASVTAGLVRSPVIAVPTSVGYGASFGGVAALLGMLNSCAEGVSVVNIDNGFGAAVSALRMLKIK